MNRMPAGKYYVGDLCYVMHDEWDEVCGLFFEGRTDHGCNEGVFTLKAGRQFASFNTAWGDGEYRDDAGRKYSVDAGLIGCIQMLDIDLLNPNNCTRGGQVIDFLNDFLVSSTGGLIRFGALEIDTDPEPEMSDEDY
jgi:hypothetical protein